MASNALSDPPMLHWSMLVSASVVPTPTLVSTAYKMLHLISLSLNKSHIVLPGLVSIY